MKRYFLILFLPLVTSCASVKYVTVINGKMLTQAHEPVSIVGSPPVVCVDLATNEHYAGYFIYEDDGIIRIDDFCHGTIYINDNVVCELKLEDNIKCE